VAVRDPTYTDSGVTDGVPLLLLTTFVAMQDPFSAG